MKIKLCTLLLTILSASDVYAIDVSTTPFGTVHATISANEPNIIHVKNDRISALTSKSEGILNDESTSDGSVVFSTKSKKAFSILVETEKGYSFIVNAVPSSKTGSTPIVIHNLAEKGSSDDETLHKAGVQNTYSGFISHILTELMNNRIPSGFTDTWKRSFDVPSELAHTFFVRKTDAWVGQNIRVVKLDITNVSMDEVELNERYFWTKGVMAIAYYPKVSTLKPNTKVFAYVMLKEDE